MPVGAGTRARRSTATVGRAGIRGFYRQAAVPRSGETMINRPAVLRFAGSTFRALALGVFALFLLHAGAATAARVYGWITQTSSLAGEDAFTIRRRMLGISYVRMVERLRRTIPRDGEYILVRGKGENEGGGSYWVRFELAPRRARYLGPWEELPDAESV